jgi:hypothetical protein
MLALQTSELLRSTFIGTVYKINQNRFNYPFVGLIQN